MVRNCITLKQVCQTKKYVKMYIEKETSYNKKEHSIG